jgi:pimeloyl-ACP methyl ester carboxylesterase
VVLVPGLGLDERSSARLRALLPADVVVLPGAGRRAPVPDLDDLAGLLREQLGEGPVLVVGHSQGCQIAAAAAVDPRVRGLVLLGPTTDPRLRRAGTLAREWLRTALSEPLRQAPRIVAQWLRTGPRAMRALWRVAAPDPADARLRALRVPVIVVRGTRDRLCDSAWARRLAAAAPHGRLVELPGAAHMTVQTHPREVADVIADTRDALDPGDSGT